MNKNKRLFIVTLLQQSPEGYAFIAKLAVNDYAPQINDSGQIVWYGSDGTDYEIFMATIPVTTSSTSTISTTTTIIVDTDKDGVPDSRDNCPNKPNGQISVPVHLLQINLELTAPVMLNVLMVAHQMGCV